MSLLVSPTIVQANRGIEQINTFLQWMAFADGNTARVAFMLLLWVIFFLIFEKWSLFRADSGYGAGQTRIGAAVIASGSLAVIINYLFGEAVEGIAISEVFTNLVMIFIFGIVSYFSYMSLRNESYGRNEGGTDIAFFFLGIGLGIISTGLYNIIDLLPSSLPEGLLSGLSIMAAIIFVGSLICLFVFIRPLLTTLKDSITGASSNDTSGSSGSSKEASSASSSSSDDSSSDSKSDSSKGENSSSDDSSTNGQKKDGKSADNDSSSKEASKEKKHSEESDEYYNGHYTSTVSGGKPSDFKYYYNDLEKVPKEVKNKAKKGFAGNIRKVIGFGIKKPTILSATADKVSAAEQINKRNIEPKINVLLTKLKKLEDSHNDILKALNENNASNLTNFISKLKELNDYLVQEFIKKSGINNNLAEEVEILEGTIGTLDVEVRSRRKNNKDVEDAQIIEESTSEIKNQIVQKKNDIELISNSYTNFSNSINKFIKAYSSNSDLQVLKQYIEDLYKSEESLKEVSAKLLESSSNSDNKLINYKNAIKKFESKNQKLSNEQIISELENIKGINADFFNALKSYSDQKLTSNSKINQLKKSIEGLQKGLRFMVYLTSFHIAENDKKSYNDLIKDMINKVETIKGLNDDSLKQPNNNLITYLQSISDEYTDLIKEFETDLGL